MQKKSIDTTLVFIVIALVIFGMIMISSVSVYPSFKITSRLVTQGILDEPNNSFYLFKNISHVIISILMLIIFSKIPYSWIEKYIREIYFSVLFLLFLVLFVGSEYNGAKWWLNVPWLPSIQPVEFAKIGLVAYLAYFIKKRRSLLPSLADGFLPFFGIVGSVFLLLAFQPDFGSILIIAPVVIALYFVGWGNIKYLFVSFLVCFIGASSIYGIWKLGGEEGNKLSYISSRMDNFFGSSMELFTKTNPDGKDYQMKQGLIAIGSGGFFGLGFGKSIQKFGYLPEVEGDFIFSVILEELGLVGMLMLFSAYLTIVYRWYTISRRVEDPFGKYLAFGIATLILVQVFVNVGVNLNVVPLTGVTLPFVSYGGSSLISLMIAIGILLNISRYTEVKPSSSYGYTGGKRRVLN